MGGGPFRIGEEVARALAAGAPVVALETAVLTHGLPGEIHVGLRVLDWERANKTRENGEEP